MALLLRARRRHRARRLRLYQQVCGVRLDTIDYLQELGGRDCIKRFRLGQREIANLTDLIGNNLERPTERSRSLSPIVQVWLISFNIFLISYNQ